MCFQGSRLFIGLARQNNKTYPDKTNDVYLLFLIRTVVFRLLFVPDIHYTITVGGTFIYYFDSYANMDLYIPDIEESSNVIRTARIVRFWG